ncbi:MAG: signal peptidase I [Elusimicrobiota bacterium]
MIRRLLFLLAIGVAATLLLRTFVIEGIYVASTSMEPTLKMGSSFFLEKLTYMFREPKRNDFIVFPSPETENYDLIKRVIAVEGDTIEIRDKAVYINGVKLAENYVKHTRPREILVGDNLGPFEIPRGMLFVMGDNRDESEDSRDWKNPETGKHSYFIPVSAVKGKLILFF